MRREGKKQVRVDSDKSEGKVSCELEISLPMGTEEDGALEGRC